jgi:CRISPR-associated endonuclease/helicase Cas3
MLYAHSANQDNNWHTLEDHSLGVASLSFDLCKIERLKDIAYNLGLLHDLGKAYPEFQERLTGKNLESFNHPGFSVYLVKDVLKVINNVRLEEIINGHHRGLDNAGLREYHLEEKHGIPQEVYDFIQLLKPFIKQTVKQKISYLDSLYLSGCLFAADWLDTGKHFKTYTKNQKSIPLNTEVSIERYINDLTK